MSDPARENSATALARLRRWETAGGGWHVVAIGAGRAEVVLERCDLGEAADSIASDEPDFVRFLETHPHSGA